MKEAAMRDREQCIALVDNSLDPSLYNPVRHWKKWIAAGLEVFRVPENRFPDAADFTHIILSGSEATILERASWAAEEIEMVKEAVRQGVSILGSCYGHQLLAVALAGPDCVRRCLEPEIGWITVDILPADSLLGKKGKAWSFTSHLDEVVGLTDDFQVLASSEKCGVQAFRFRGKPVWGLQIHPEINIREAKKYLRARVARGHEPRDLFRQAQESEPRDSGLIHHIVEWFLSGPFPKE